MVIDSSSTNPYPELSLVELAAHGVIETSTRLDKQKIPLSDEAKKRLHGTWIDIKAALSGTAIPQIMHTIEKSSSAQETPQRQNTADFAPKIGSLWEKLTEVLGSNSLPIDIDSCRSVHKQWENEALGHFWSVISQQINQPPSLTAIEDIEAWFEDPANSKTLKTIKEITLSNSTIKVFPPQLLKCSELETLIFTKNQLITLPEWFGNLSQLKFLYFDKNQLTTLPVSFGNLRQLKDLDLRNNQIASLPESFGNLRQLQYLHLHNNQLTTFPESFGNLKQLSCLYLTFNKITTLPESFSNLSQLRYFGLNDNQLTTLPESFGHLSQLQCLDLSGNKITTLPVSFGNLNQLNVLGLEHD